MSKIFRKTTKPYKHLIKKELGKNPTADDVLDHIFGDYEGYVNSRYTIREYVKSDSNLAQRLNRFWAYPLFLLFVFPLKWVFTGVWGCESESKTMKVLKFLMGDIS
mgnify:CR=1 FL=1